MTSLKRANDATELPTGKIPKLSQVLLKARIQNDSRRPGTVIWHLNIRGLRDKLEYLKHAIHSSTNMPDIIAI